MAEVELRAAKVLIEDEWPNGIPSGRVRAAVAQPEVSRRLGTA